MPEHTSRSDQENDLRTLANNLFDKWQLSDAERHDLLGFGDDFEDRIGWLLAIHKALRLLYPQNPEICYSWVKMRNRAFDDQAPLQIMQKEGLQGIKAVARHLDSWLFDCDCGSDKPRKDWDKAFEAMHAAGDDALLR